MATNKNMSQHTIMDHGGDSKMERLVTPIVNNQPLPSPPLSPQMKNMGIEQDDLNSSQNSTMSYRELQPIPSNYTASSQGTQAQKSSATMKVSAEEGTKLRGTSVKKSPVQTEGKKQGAVKHRQVNRLSREEVSKAIKLYIEKLKREKVVTINDKKEKKAANNGFRETQGSKTINVSEEIEEIDISVRSGNAVDADVGINLNRRNTNSLEMMESSDGVAPTASSEHLGSQCHRNQSMIINHFNNDTSGSSSSVQPLTTEPGVIIEDTFEDPEASVYTTKSVNNVRFESLNNRSSKRKRLNMKSLKNIINSIFKSIQLGQVFHSKPKRFESTNEGNKRENDLDEPHTRMNGNVPHNNDHFGTLNRSESQIGACGAIEGRAQGADRDSQHDFELEPAKEPESETTEIDIHSSFPSRLHEWMKLQKRKK